MNSTYEHESLWLNLFEIAKHKYIDLTGHPPSRELIARWEAMPQNDFKQFVNVNLRQVWLICMIF